MSDLWCDCDLAGPDGSEAAIASLRVLLSEPSVFEDEPAFPVILTVYTAQGTVTVENVREDSIKREGTDLICEADDGSSKCPLYRFFDVQGYSTTFA